MTSPLPGTKPRPYLRPMRGAWWRRDPFFVRYMWREATALCVLACACLWTAALVCLSLGEAVWNSYLAAMRSAPAVALHAVLLVGMVYHAYTWFEVMPKTMPGIYTRTGARVPDATIKRWGLAALAAASIALWTVLWMVRT